MIRAAALIVLITCTSMLAYVPEIAHAQFSIPGAGSSVWISMSPQYPAPGETVTLSLSSTLYDLESSTITWRANGALVASGVGDKEVQLTAGALGEETAVVAAVDSDAGSASTDLSFSPSTVDLLWESTSYTPPFYRGRALPSSGSSITLVALPHFGGSEPPANSITYTWKRDGRILGSLSGRGKSSAVIDGPMLYGTTLVTVDAAKLDGSAAGETSVRIADQPATLTLYEDHPLYGILYNDAFAGTDFSAGTESAFTAIPYFAPIATPHDPQLSYEWTVNQKQIEPDPKNPDEITISAANSSGAAQIGLGISDSDNYFYSVDARWNITLGANAADGQNLQSNPFPTH